MGTTFEAVWKRMSNEQRHAFHMKAWAALGGQTNGAANMDLLMAGRFRFRTEEVMVTFFDETTGRRIPPQEMRSKVVDANRDFHLVQPEIDYAVRLGAIARQLAEGRLFISADEFESRSKAVLARLLADKLTANLAKKAIRLPFCLPQMQITDHGTTLDEAILPAVGRAYTRQFPDRRFENYRKGTLAGQVTVVPGSRHERFLEAMGKGPVVGIYFPAVLQGFSIDADLEQMDTLPAEFLLSGALEPSAAMIAYPDVLARDYYTPGLDCAAVRSQGDSLYFKAHADRLDFCRRDLHARVSYSGGLVVLG